MSKLYISRKLEKILKKAIEDFPVALVTGARQSGKSTMLKTFLKGYSYISFDDLTIRKLAKDDPKLFLDIYKPPLIIDEVQYVPSILHYLKIKVDANRDKKGQYVLTGSQIFQLMEGVSESLAGRIAVLNLYPFSFEEIDKRGEDFLFDRMIGGFFPEPTLVDKIDKNLWFSSYFSTYIERDVRNIKAISDLGRFQIFIELLTARVGSILNLSEVSKECGISQTTAKNWLTILQATYVIYLLKPFHNNKTKQLVKSPKLYFLDTGLLSYLLGIDNKRRLLSAKERGHIFENLIIMDCLKRISYQTRRIDLFFYRTRAGVEVDLIIKRGEELMAYDIKFTKNVTRKMIMALKRFESEFKIKEAGIIAISSDVQIDNRIVIKPWNSSLF